MFFRSAATVILTALGFPAAALCVGDNYLDQLSVEQHARLNAAVEEIPFSQGLIWDAHKDGHDLKIVGTMHIYDPRLDTLYAKLSDDVVNADLILVEASPEDQAALQQLMSTDPGQLFLTEGPTLPELLGDETWELLSTAAADRNIPSFMIAKMQPWYASIVLAIPSCAMEDMIAGELGLDHMIMGAATEANIPIQSLENFKTMFSIFQSEPLEEQLDVLRMSLMMPDVQQQIFVGMLDRYFAEDIGTLWQMSRIAMDDLPDMDAETATQLFDETQEAMLDGRNRNWIPVIAQAAAENDKIVIAAGAAHLIGENGILSLLQNEGWTITRDD
ncbi:hypothetical protein CLV80_110100 [Yoonia maritima]|uniref:TraB family protein n=1 Tax=Yoonia maritima TaxID=1435347 RepID=A0A2T0VW89_9RHOB|nr:TraB/GumN family protein [Yoonia maritima]PRY76014.1 hypothetical protein CLV80_110100 [Yoonia maritima]